MLIFILPKGEYHVWTKIGCTVENDDAYKHNITVKKKERKKKKKECQIAG